MIQNRRLFLNTRLIVLGCSLASSLILQSCLPERSDPLIVEYIGKSDGYDYYNDYFKKIKKVNLVPVSLENEIKSSSIPVLLDGELTHRAAYAVLLIEQDKDVIFSNPIATNLLEYNSIKQYLLRHDRRLGLVNPLIYYHSVRSLKGMSMLYENPIESIRISCHPDEIVPGFRIDGYAGTAQLLERVVSYFSGSLPEYLTAEKDGNGLIRGLQLEYPSFICSILFDRSQAGWEMDVEGMEFRARLDHLGELKINDEPQSRVKPSSRTWDEAMIQNLENFLEAVQSRTVPAPSSIDGLASIILNKAVEESLDSGTRVRL